MIPINPREYLVSFSGESSNVSLNWTNCYKIGDTYATFEMMDFKAMGGFTGPAVVNMPSLSGLLNGPNVNPGGFGYTLGTTIYDIDTLTYDWVNLGEVAFFAYPNGEPSQSILQILSIPTFDEIISQFTAIVKLRFYQTPLPQSN